jgi:hypothetical protein
MKTSLLVVVILAAALIISIATSLSDCIVYAHNFSESENALFLTLVHQIEAQISLAQNSFPSNPKLAEQHVNVAIDLLNQDDPVVNLTWTSQISERNPRIANELTTALNSLKNAASTTSNTTSSSVNDIKVKVDMINGLLGEAVSSRLTKEQLNNSTTQALVLANMANEVHFSYGGALGESPSTMSNMAGMAMSVNEASSSSPSPTNMSTNKNVGNNHAGTNTHVSMTNSNNNNNIKNMTQYQTAQALASKAVEVFDKNLKSTAPTSLKAANTEIENDLNQLKTVIDNKAPFMDVMKIVHIQLHPTLITAYNLQLKGFQ